MTGPWRDRWDPTSPKANSWWAKMYAAKRRAIDRALLASMERELAAMEKPSMTDQARRWMETETEYEQADKDERARIARAFGRPAP